MFLKHLKMTQKSTNAEEHKQNQNHLISRLKPQKLIFTRPFLSPALWRGN